MSPIQRIEQYKDCKWYNNFLIEFCRTPLSNLVYLANGANAVSFVDSFDWGQAVTDTDWFDIYETLPKEFTVAELYEFYQYCLHKYPELCI